MNITPHLPFFFPIVRRRFKLDEKTCDTLALTWGDRIYTRNPQEFAHPQKQQHEMVHTMQQRSSRLYGLIWWAKYLTSAEFRFNSELEAYRNEWRWVEWNIRDKHQGWRYLDGMAKMLSSEHYGSLVSFDEARRLIKQPIHTIPLRPIWDERMRKDIEKTIK